MTTRREFLVRGTAAAAGLTALQFLPGCEATTIERKVSGVSFDFVTKADDWYWQTGNNTSPDEAEALDLSRDNWELSVTGPDGTIGSLDFERLRGMEPMTYVKTMKCVYFTPSGTVDEALVSTGVFKGVPLPRIFENLGGVPSESTAKVRTRAADGFEGNLTVDRATRSGPDPLPAMLAFELNGRPLPKLRGGPVRLVIPEMWGYKNMKWIEALEFTPSDEPFGVYEEEERDPKFVGNDSIDDPARIALTTIGTNPVGNADVEGPNVTVQGVSVVGGSTITDVEIKVDDREWKSADIKSADEILASTSDPAYTALQEARNFDVDDWPPKNVWVIWTAPLEELSSGNHRLLLRARDARGEVNPPVGELEHRVGPKSAQQRSAVSFSVK